MSLSAMFERTRSWGASILNGEGKAEKRKRLEELANVQAVGNEAIKLEGNPGWALFQQEMNEKYMRLMGEFLNARPEQMLSIQAEMKALAVVLKWLPEKRQAQLEASIEMAKLNGVVPEEGDDETDEEQA